LIQFVKIRAIRGKESMMKFLHVVGARPNFMKVAPVLAALAERPGVEQLLVHTGQHYDANMSAIFFQQLGIPEPDINLEVGSGSHAVQTAQIMTKFEGVVLAQKPDMVLVYGDINSTVAATLVCAKLQIPVSHVEAGLRSGDRTMPEEINRLVTDQIADLLFTPSPDGDENLLREGVAPVRIHFVGNVMIDTLVRLLPQAEALDIVERLQLTPHGYGLITLHRPSNVDEPAMLYQLVQTLEELSTAVPLLFPIHPRTRARLADFPFRNQGSQIKFTEPLGYLEFLALQKQAKLIITDSGGIQEESTYLGVPCLTVRENTERPVTVTVGTNLLIGQDMDRLCQETHKILAGAAKVGQIPALWDGKASARIAAILTGDKRPIP
jgi:UDP-N-acetylglucosamine 2-epimerase (non-hydrolysing)